MPPGPGEQLLISGSHLGDQQGKARGYKSGQNYSTLSGLLETDLHWVVSGLVGPTGTPKSAPNPVQHLDDLSKSHIQAAGAAQIGKKGVVETKPQTLQTHMDKGDPTRAQQALISHSQPPSFQRGTTLLPPLTRRRDWDVQEHLPPLRLLPTIPTTEPGWM